MALGEVDVNETMRSLPRAVELGGRTIELRLMAAADEAAVLEFARALPEHDLLFLPRDITQTKVASAWSAAIAGGEIVTVLAWRGDEVVGCGAVVRDPRSWSPHVAELRVVLAESVRGQGLGHLLTQEAFAQALGAGAEKLTAHMTLDQKGAQSVFEGLGFTVEAVLKDHVKERSGRKSDLLILSHDVGRIQDRHAAYGMGEGD